MQAGNLQTDKLDELAAYIKEIRARMPRGWFEWLCDQPGWKESNAFDDDGFCFVRSTRLESFTAVSRDGSIEFVGDELPPLTLPEPKR